MNEQDWCIPALLDFVRSMSRRVDLHVYTLRWPEVRRRYQVYGAEVTALGGYQHMGVRVGKLWLDTLRAIHAEHQRQPFDLVHAIWADEPGWIAVTVGRLLSRPVVVSLAGGELSALRDIGYGLRRLPGRGALVAGCLNAAQCITVGSDYMKKLAIAMIGAKIAEKLVWAPLGADEALFGKRTIAVAKRTADRLVNVGSLTPVKNQGLLINTLPRLSQTSLNLAGSGPLKDDLMCRLRGLGLATTVHLLGDVPHERMPSLYEGSGLFVQTSRHEAQGLAVIEAAMTGLPICGTNVGVLPEIGAAVDSRASFMELAQLIIESQARAKELGQRGQQVAMEKYSLSAATERFCRIYEQLASRN